MTGAIWLFIKLVQYIMPIHILTKFCSDWTKASKVIGWTTYWTPQVKQMGISKPIIKHSSIRENSGYQLSNPIALVPHNSKNLSDTVILK